jgi:hypothetical protein
MSLLTVMFVAMVMAAFNHGSGKKERKSNVDR